MLRSRGVGKTFDLGVGTVFNETNLLYRTVAQTENLGVGGGGPARFLCLCIG